MIQLETKSRKFTCPSCGTKKTFKRYVGADGRYLGDHVGICDRLNNCGYHYTPKMYYADNPGASDFKPGKEAKRPKTIAVKPAIQPPAPQGFDFIPFEQFRKTLSGYENNAFVQFLLDLFPEDRENTLNALKTYFVGTYQDYTCFPQIDGAKRICKAKLIKFNSTTGRRLKGEYDTSSLVAKLKIKENFNYRQTFFGEHLLAEYPNKPVAVVESEKSAIIASLCFPELIWLGSNSKTWLKPERLARCGTRQIILYPDADGFELWSKVAADARRSGLRVKVSSLIETMATAEQKAHGYDLADYLIAQQQAINEFNAYADEYNSKLEMMLRDENVRCNFETILEEQKAVMVIDGEMPESVAETIVTQFENIRSVVLSV